MTIQVNAATQNVLFCPFQFHSQKVKFNRRILRVCTWLDSWLYYFSFIWLPVALWNAPSQRFSFSSQPFLLTELFQQCWSIYVPFFSSTCVYVCAWKHFFSTNTIILGSSSFQSGIAAQFAHQSLVRSGKLCRNMNEVCGRILSSWCQYKQIEQSRSTCISE